MAKLLFVFTCEVDKTSYPIALIQPHDSPTGDRTLKDKDFGFYRVRAQPRTRSEFVSVQSIVRGILLAQDPDFPEEFLVVDVVDTDMYLRMKSLQL